MTKKMIDSHIYHDAMLIYYFCRMNGDSLVARDNSKVLVLAWKDKRAVKAISTKYDAFATAITRRKKRGAWRGGYGRGPQT